MPEMVATTDRLMTREEAAEYLGVPVRTLRFWSETGTGPRRIKFGRHIRFDRADLLAWVESRKVPART